MGILEIKDVNKRFGGLQALSNVNLSIEEGTRGGPKLVVIRPPSYSWLLVQGDTCR